MSKRKHDNVERLGLSEEKAEAAARYLLEAFDWSETAEDFKFWNKVCTRLEAFGRGETK